MIHWSELVAAVYAVCDAVGIDPVLNEITSIYIGENTAIVRYLDENGVQRHISKKYEM